MPLPLLLALASVAVRPEPTVLRSACAADAAAVAQLKGGEAASLRFAFSGDIGTCYKITVQTGEGEKTGYVLAAELGGTDTFERSRREASERDVPQLIRGEVARLRESVAKAGNAPAGLAEAVRLLELKQAHSALAILETELRRPEVRGNPHVLAMAGLAAYQGDNPRKAAGYLADSLQLQPNPSIQALLGRVRGELAADTSREKVHGGRFVLRYDGNELPYETAAAMNMALENEWSRVAGRLGCRSEDKIIAIVQSREAYLRSTGAAEWSGGQYDGRIHVALLEGATIGPQTRQTFAHELVHACLAQFGSWPAWFHEGMAQRHSGEERPWRPQPGAPRLDALGAGWGGLNANQAAYAYAMALAAVNRLYADYGEEFVRNLLREPARLAALAPQLARRLAAD